MDEIKIEEIKNAVASAFKITPIEFKKVSRYRRYTDARTCLTYMLVKYAGMGVVAIGKLYGMNHTTIIHYRNSFEVFKKVDPKFMAKAEQAEQEISQRYSPMKINVLKKSAWQPSS